MEKQLGIRINPGQTGKMPRPVYRVYQFFQALTAPRLSARENEEVAVLLTPSQQALFQRMRASDQRHSLHVMQSLKAEKRTQQELLVAALLHDVGKTFYPLRLWERPVVVLIRHYRPEAAVRWGRQSGIKRMGWKRPFVIYEQHAEWGAKMAEEANCSPLTSWLIRWHHAAPEHLGVVAGLKNQDDPSSKLLRYLQWADSVN